VFDLQPSDLPPVCEPEVNSETVTLLPIEQSSTVSHSSIQILILNSINI